MVTFAHPIPALAAPGSRSGRGHDPAEHRKQHDEAERDEGLADAAQHEPDLVAERGAAGRRVARRRRVGDGDGETDCSDSLSA